MAGIDIISDSTGKEIVAAIQSTDVAQARILEINTAAEAKKNEVLESIPEDYSNISKEVDELKGDIVDVQNGHGIESNSIYPEETIFFDNNNINMINPRKLKSGKFYNYDGSLSDEVGEFYYEEFIPIKKEKYWIISSFQNHFVRVVVYDQNKNLISYREIITNDFYYYSPLNIYQSSFEIGEENAKYIRFSYYDASGNGKFMIEDNRFNDFTDFKPYDYEKNTIKEILLPDSVKNENVVNEILKEDKYDSYDFTKLEASFYASETASSGFRLYGEDNCTSIRFFVKKGRTYTVKVKGNNRFCICGCNEYCTGFVFNQANPFGNQLSRDFDTLIIRDLSLSEYTFTVNDDTKTVFVYLSANLDISKDDIFVFEEENHKLNGVVIDNKQVRGLHPYFWNPTNELDALGGESSFADYRWTSNQIYENIYDKLVEQNPDYVSKKNLGKDASNKYDIYAYEFEPPYYEQVVVLQSGVHPEEKESYLSLARFLQILCEDSTLNETIDYIRHCVKLVVVPMVNVWGISEGAGNGGRVNANGVDLNRDMGDDEITQAENIAISNYYLTIDKPVSCFFDLHTTVNPRFGDYYGVLNTSQNNYRLFMRVAWYLAIKNVGANADLSQLGESSEYSEHIWSSWAERNLNCVSATIEHSDWRWDSKKHTTENINKSMEYQVNELIEHVRHKFATCD